MPTAKPKAKAVSFCWAWMAKQGVGKVLMKNALKLANGSVALHVEPDNPAVHLYKKIGFTNKYLEMRYEQ